MDERKSYIGITGFTNANDVASALDVFPQESSRSLMVGILASKGSLEGEGSQTWFKARVPPADRIPSLLSSDPRALNLFHYLTDEPETLSDQLTKAYQTFSPLLHGFQINFLIWPDPANLRIFRERFPDARLIIQITDQAFGTLLGSPKRLVSRLQSYQGTVTDILLDASAGQGKTLDPVFLFPYIEAIQASELHESFGITVAGGLSASTMKAVEPIVKKYPNISIDAEGRLRDTNDDLDPAAVKSYLLEALTLFQI